MCWEEKWATECLPELAIVCQSVLQGMSYRTGCHVLESAKQNGPENVGRNELEYCLEWS